MKPPSARLLAQVRVVAGQLPPSVLTAVCQSIESSQTTNHQALCRSLLPQLPKPSWRQAVKELFAIWQQDNKTMKAESIAASLQAASYCIEQAHLDLNVEVVWTGPDVSRLAVRRTQQVLLQLIRSSVDELTLVSFAVYKVPALSEAIVDALNRGVRVRLIAETPEGKAPVPFGVSAGLGQEIAARADVYEWPREKRPRDKTGRYGSLHMKIAIADCQHLFITSANLTHYALSLNMEMGLLVHSEATARQVLAHIDQLIQQKIISSLETRERK